MTWWRSLSVLLCILTALVSPRTASGASAVHAETRVKGFFLVATALVGGTSARTLEKHRGNAVAYDETASGYALAAEVGGFVNAGAYAFNAPTNLSFGDFLAGAGQAFVQGALNGGFIATAAAISPSATFLGIGAVGVSNENDLWKLGLAAPLATGGAGGSCSKAGADRVTSGSQVTEQTIRNAMKDAPFQSQQRGGISLPRVQQYVDRLLAGESPPPIKVDGDMIVDGNHRYVAGRIVGQDPPVQEWLGGRPQNAVPWSEIPIDPEDWE